MSQNKRAVLFDMDGVLVGSELLLHERREEYLAFFEELIAAQLLVEVEAGKHVYGTFLRAKELGSTRTEEEFYAALEKLGDDVYAAAPVATGLPEFLELLRREGYGLGVVSASPKFWMEAGLARAGVRDFFDVILSLDRHPTLAPKPAPDGYLFAMETLGVLPEHTVIVEDSNTGIEAGKVSQALVIGYTEFLVPGYVQEGADMYLATMAEIGQWVQFMNGGQ